MDIKDIINGLSEEEVAEFLKDNVSKINATTKVHKVISDTSWIEMIEDAIPYLDNIIRNPRRFIVQEENIVPIEKTKVVTEESIRHLAQNTNLIQDVEEDGTVIPLKLLNVYREETVDLYENRFIKSLVDNLYQFVNNKLAESDQKSRVKSESSVSFDSKFDHLNEVVDVNLKLTRKNDTEIMTPTKDGHSLETRIEHIKDVIAAFKGSQFIKSLQASQPVRSPIRKTNVILKEQNFIKALELWEYLESNEIKPMVEVTDEVIDQSQDVKNYFDLAFFIQNSGLKLQNNENYDKVKIAKNLDLREIINEMLAADASLREIKAVINKELKYAWKVRMDEEKAVKNKFKAFIKEYEGKKQKAFELLK